MMKLMLVLAVALPCPALTVELRPEAEAASAYIRLSDVASLTDAKDDERARVEGLFLGRAPKDGAEATVTREEILGELRKQGIPPASVRFTGAEKSVVTRAVAREATPDRAFARKLQHAIALFFRKQPLFAGAEVEVQIVGDVEVPKTEGAIAKVEPDESPATGLAWYTATWKPQGGGAAGAEQPISFQARVTAFVEAVVAKRPLAARTMLTEDDIDIVRQAVSAGKAYCTAPSDVVGQQLARPVAKGGCIDPSCLAAEVLIRPRDPVHVQVTGKGYTIEFYAEAVAEGQIGQVVNVKNMTTGRLFPVRVTGRGQAELALSGEGGKR